MRIAVCVKQVPAGSARMDAERGILLRGEAAYALNPWDACAIEAAVQAAERTGGELIALSMGPACAMEALREAIAMGANRGVLLCDKAFAGADVLVTAYTLAQGIRALGGFDIIFCGQQTTDGGTAQVPFSLAVQTGAHIAGWVKKVEDVSPQGITMLQELSGGTQRLTLPYPAVVAVGREAAVPRIPSLKARLRAKSADVRCLTLADMPDADASHYGLTASPTRVVKVYENIVQAKAEALQLSPQEAAELLCAELKEARHG
jgi:electron transfer flavoprotein beta subunit